MSARYGLDMMNDFYRGQQIVYIPNHANGDKGHPDCERGFVTSANEQTVFCRFWHRSDPGILRNRSNSESCRVEDVESEPDYIPQEVVDAWLTIIDWENS